LVRVLCGTLPGGTLKAVGEAFNIRPKKVAKEWHFTLKTVPGPTYPSFIIANVPPAASETKFANAGSKQQFDHETVAYNNEDGAWIPI
jgi:hypothetical protein